MKKTPEEKKEHQRKYVRDWRDRRQAQGLTVRGTMRKVFDDDIRLLPNEKRSLLSTEKTARRR